MSGETFVSKHGEKRRQYDFAVSAEGCRNALYSNDGTAYWLRNTLLAIEHNQPCMQSPAKQLVAYFLLGALPTQLDDLCEQEIRQPSWWRKILSNFVVGEH